MTTSAETSRVDALMEDCLTAKEKIDAENRPFPKDKDKDDLSMIKLILSPEIKSSPATKEDLLRPRLAEDWIPTPSEAIKEQLSTFTLASSRTSK